MAKDWIEKGDKHPGRFAAKAKAAGMSTKAYAAKEAGAPGKLGQEARFAQNAAKARKGR